MACRRVVTIAEFCLPCVFLEFSFAVTCIRTGKFEFRIESVTEIYAEDISFVVFKVFAYPPKIVIFYVIPRKTAENAALEFSRIEEGIVLQIDTYNGACRIAALMIRRIGCPVIYCLSIACSRRIQIIGIADFITAKTTAKYCSFECAFTKRSLRTGKLSIPNQTLFICIELKSTEFNLEVIVVALRPYTL